MDALISLEDSCLFQGSRAFQARRLQPGLTAMMLDRSLESLGSGRKPFLPAIVSEGLRAVRKPLCSAWAGLALGLSRSLLPFPQVSVPRTFSSFPSRFVLLTWSLPRRDLYLWMCWLNTVSWSQRINQL